MNYFELPPQVKVAAEEILLAHVRALNSFRNDSSNIEYILDYEMETTQESREIIYNYLKNNYVALVSVSDRFSDFESADSTPYEDQLIPRTSNSTNKIVIQPPFYSKPLTLTNRIHIRATIGELDNVSYTVHKPSIYLSSKNRNICDYFKFSTTINHIKDYGLQSILIIDPMEINFKDFINKSFDFFLKHLQHLANNGLIIEGNEYRTHIDDKILKDTTSMIDILKQEYINAINEKREPVNVRSNISSIVNTDVTWNHILNHVEKIDLKNELLKSLNMNSIKKDKISKI